MSEKAIRVENISKGKPIGIGSMTVLPGETKSVPVMYWGSPVLKMYADLGFLRIIEVGASEKSGAGVPDGAPTESASSADNAPTPPTVADSVPETESAPDGESVPDDAPEDAAEALRKARLASLNGLTEAELGKLAEELGIRPADCKDAADMKKKVRAALKK